MEASEHPLWGAGPGHAGTGTTLRSAWGCQRGTLIVLVLLRGKGEGRRRQMGAKCWSLTSSVACLCDGLPGSIWSVFSQPWFQCEGGAHAVSSLFFGQKSSELWLCPGVLCPVKRMKLELRCVQFYIVCLTKEKKSWPFPASCSRALWCEFSEREARMRIAPRRERG